MFELFLTALAAAAVSVPTPAATTAVPSDAGTRAAAARRYCVDTYVTGSRIAHRECRTRADWMKDGFDPLERN